MSAQFNRTVNFLFANPSFVYIGLGCSLIYTKSNSVMHIYEKNFEQFDKERDEELEYFMTINKKPEEVKPE